MKMKMMISIGLNQTNHMKKQRHTSRLNEPNMTKKYSRINRNLADILQELKNCLEIAIVNGLLEAKEMQRHCLFVHIKSKTTSIKKIPNHFPIDGCDENKVFVLSCVEES